MRPLYIPFKGLYRALIPSFPTKNQPDEFPEAASGGTIVDAICGDGDWSLDCKVLRVSFRV